MTHAEAACGGDGTELPLDRLPDDGVIDLDPRVRALIPVLPGDEGEDDDDE